MSVRTMKASFRSLDRQQTDHPGPGEQDGEACGLGKCSQYHFLASHGDSWLFGFPFELACHRDNSVEYAGCPRGRDHGSGEQGETG